MKQYTIDQVVENVRIKYDEISINESDMINNSDSSDIDSVIRSCINDAYRFVINNADLSMLEGKQIEGDDILTIDENLIGHVNLPDDFLRGITFRLSSWQSSASDIITEDTPEYRMQSDPYACGTWQHPVAALVHTASGRELELYKAKTPEDTLKSFVYAPRWIQTEDSVSVPDQLAEAFIYYVAALTATTFREDVANDFFKVARSLIGLE